MSSQLTPRRELGPRHGDTVLAMQNWLAGVVVLGLCGCVTKVVYLPPQTGLPSNTANAGTVDTSDSSDVCQALARALPEAKNGFRNLADESRPDREGLASEQGHDDDVASTVIVDGARVTVQITGIPDFSVRYRETGPDVYDAVLAEVKACAFLQDPAWEREFDDDADDHDVTYRRQGRGASKRNDVLWITMHGSGHVVVMLF